MTTHRQHTVWLHYLEAWRDGKRKVHYSRNGKILPPTNPINVVVERDFYKLAPITRVDADFLEHLIIQPTEPAELRKCHRDLVTNLAYIPSANKIIQSDDRTSPAEKRDAQALVIETEEKLHVSIEQSARPLLDKLRQKRADFIDNDDSAIMFFHFIAHQYFRTKRIREAIGEVLSQISPDHDFAHLKNIACYISAVNLGASLFKDRNRVDFIFLDNRNALKFITGDQPVVNLMGTGDSNETTELALYYPLTPNLSCLVSPREYKLSSADISSAIVRELNDLIAWESHQFLIANSDTVLQCVLGEPPLSRPSPRCILDTLVTRWPT